MSEDSKTASPRPAASGAAYRIAAIAVAVVAVAAIVVSLVVATPRLGEASKTRNLVELLEKVELAQRAVATELNDIRLEYLTNKSPDEKQTDDAIAALNAAADAVGVGSLDLPEDQPGARPRALLTDGPEQLAQARESLSGHTTDQDFVDHEQLLRDGWLVANAIPPALEPLDAAAATAAKEFVESAESVPVPLIEPQAQGEDQRLDQLEAMAAPFEDDSSSAKTFSYLLYGVSAVLVLAAAALFWLALRSRRRPAPGAAGAPAVPAALDAAGPQPPADKAGLKSSAKAAKAARKEADRQVRAEQKALAARAKTAKAEAAKTEAAKASAAKAAGPAAPAQSLASKPAGAKSATAATASGQAAKPAAPGAGSRPAPSVPAGFAVAQPSAAAPAKAAPAGPPATGVGDPASSRFAPWQPAGATPATPPAKAASAKVTPAKAAAPAKAAPSAKAAPVKAAPPAKAAAPAAGAAKAEPGKKAAGATPKIPWRATKPDSDKS